MENQNFKYSLDIESIDLNGSHGIILSQIRKNSIVLECGCATGYMTKFMSNKLNCDVYIVEYDKNAFDIAKQYAKDGICSDLMEDYWIEKFEKIFFDYIIFADVLEHLYDPLAVLKKAAKKLKYNGCILASIPNITHNDVIINMLNDSWTYTELGLLDNTHIRFWGERDLEPFFNKAGLTITVKNYIQKPLGLTEQALSAIDANLQQYFNKRHAGNIYQFVVTASLIEYVNSKEITSQIKETQDDRELSNLYYSNERNFDGRNCMPGYYAPPHYSQRFYLQDKNTAFLRFDPIEQCGCIVKDIEIITDTGEILNSFPINGFRIENIDAFISSDPQYTIETKGMYIHWIDIQMQIEPLRNQLVISSFMRLVNKNEEISCNNALLSDAHDKVVQDRTNMIENTAALQAAYDAVVQDRTNLIENTAALQAAYDAVVQDRTNVIENTAALQAAYDAVAQDRTNLIENTAALQAAYDAVVQDRTNLIEDTAALQTAYDAVVQDRTNLIENCDLLAQERADILVLLENTQHTLHNTLYWKITKNLRTMSNAIKRIFIK